MRVPLLRRRMVLEMPRRSADGAGGFVQHWQALGEVWVAVTALQGRDTVVGAAAMSQAALERQAATDYAQRIVLRASPEGSPMRPRPDHRLREGARIFTILAVGAYDPAGRYLTCFTREEVAR